MGALRGAKQPSAVGKAPYDHDSVRVADHPSGIVERTGAERISCDTIAPAYSLA